MSRNGAEPISTTDLLLFKHLANPEKTRAPDDVGSLLQLHPPRSLDGDGFSPKRSFDARSPAYKYNDSEMHRNADSEWGFFNKNPPGHKEDDLLFRQDSATWRHEDSSGQKGGDGPSSAGMFESYVKSELDRMKPSSGGIPDSSRPPHGGSHRREGEGMPSNYSSQFYDSHEQYGPSRQDFGSGGGPPPLNIPSPSSPFFTSSSRPDRPSYEEESSSESSQAQRQLIIASLRKHQQRGHALGIEISLDTPLHVLRTELDLIEESLNSITMVNNMRNGMNIAMRLCEFGCQKLGEPIPLSGWTEKSLDENPNMYDHSLERIYNMYWRNSYAHPISELGMTMAFSGGGYAIQNWLSGGSSSYRQPNNNNNFNGKNTHGPAPPPFRPPSNSDGGKSIPNSYSGGGGFSAPMGPGGQFRAAGQPARPAFRPPFTSQQSSRSEPVTSIPTH